MKIVSGPRGLWRLFLNFPYLLRKLSGLFLLLIALLFFIGGVIAVLVGSFSLSDIIFFIYNNHMGRETENTIAYLIRIAEYLLVGITFFAISTRILLGSFFHLESESDYEDSEKALTRKLEILSDLERYVIGMVIATISVAFIGLVINVSENPGSFITTNSTNYIPSIYVDLILKAGIGIAAVIASLGLYQMFLKK